MPRRLGDVSAQSAAHPATCGVAMLVPLIDLYAVGLGHEENMSLPGAAISTFPELEKLEGVRFESREATDMIVGELAGEPVVELALPAAATIKQPLFNAACPAAV